MNIYITPTFNTQAVTAKVNSILTEAQMYNDALQNDEPVTVPSGRTWGRLLSTAQQIRIECEVWLVDNNFTKKDYVAADYKVTAQIVDALEHFLLQGKTNTSTKVQQ